MTTRDEEFNRLDREEKLQREVEAIAERIVVVMPPKPYPAIPTMPRPARPNRAAALFQAGKRMDEQIAEALERKRRLPPDPFSIFLACADPETVYDFLCETEQSGDEFVITVRAKPKPRPGDEESR